MKDILIKIDSKTSKVTLPTDTLGIRGENLQGKIRFELTTFIDGEGILLVQQDYDGSCRQNYIHMNKVNNGYEIDIKSSLLKGWKVDLQLQINEPNTGNGIPIFKSNVFFLKVGEQINAGTEIPDEYPSAFVIDENYVHTDNNYTDEDKTKVQNFTPYDDTEIRGEITLVDNKANQNATDIVALERTKADKSELPTKTSDLVNNSGFITNSVSNLTNYELKTNTGNNLNVSIDSSTYVMTIQLKNSANEVLSTQSIDLPLEATVIGASYDSSTKELVLTLQSGSTTRISIADLISGLQNEITSENKLDADLVDDTNANNKFVTSTDKTNWDGKANASDVYTKQQVDNIVAGIVQISDEEPTNGALIWIDTHTLDYIGEALNEIIPDTTTTEYDMTEDEIGAQLDEIIGGQE